MAVVVTAAVGGELKLNKNILAETVQNLIENFFRVHETFDLNFGPVLQNV